MDCIVGRLADGLLYRSGRAITREITGMGASVLEPQLSAKGEPQKGRRLVNLLLGGGVLASIASFLYPALRYIIPPQTAESGSNSVIAGKVADFKRNTGAIFKFGEKPGILIHTADGEWKAFSAVCTH